MQRSAAHNESERNALLQQFKRWRRSNIENDTKQSAHFIDFAIISWYEAHCAQVKPAVPNAPEGWQRFHKKEWLDANVSQMTFSHPLSTTTAQHTRWHQHFVHLSLWSTFT